MRTPDVVLITGCTTGGIGHALANEFSKAGCMVYATSRRAADVRDVPLCRVLPLDVCDRASIQAAVDTIILEQGRIDVLVNNAGIGCTAPLVEVDLEFARKTYEVNVLGTLAVTQAVAPQMISRRRGKIINVGSVVGLISTPFSGVYSCTKAAVHSLTDALRLELQPFNVQAMVVVPGGIKSNMGKNNAATIDTMRFKIYAPWAAAIHDRAQASQGPNATPTAVFASNVVKQVLRDQLRRRFLFGHMSTLFWLVSLFPRWVADVLLAQRFKLSKAAAPAQQLQHAKGS